MSNRNSLQTSQKNVGENPARRRDREESEDEDVPQSGEMPTAPPEVLAQRVIRKVRRPPTTSLMEHAPPALEPDMAASRIQAEAAGNPFASLASSSALASTASSELFAKFQNEPSAEKKDQQDRVHHSSTTHKVETNQNATFKFSFVSVANQGGNDGSKGVFSDTELLAGVERAGKPSNNTTCDDGVGVIRGVIDGHPEANSSEHGWVHKEANVLLRTGEEGEVNLVCCLVRAYVASKETKAWCEFSRGELRLNESLSHGDHVTPQDPLSTSTTHSPERRIVMRDEKTRKVILNTVLHPSSVTLGPLMDRKNFTFTTVTRVEQDGTDADGCINKEKEPEYVTRSYLIRYLSATTPEHFMKLHETIRMTLEEHNNVPSAEESK